MRYLFAIICPPVAVLLCGKPFQFVISILLTLCFWIPGMIHAILVVNSHLADKRSERLEKAILTSRNRASFKPQEPPRSYAGLMLVAVAVSGVGLYFLTSKGAAFFVKREAAPKPLHESEKVASPTPPQNAVPSLPAATTPPPASQVARFASVEQAQQEALRRYPDLGVAGSKFNAEFVVRHQRYKRENSAFLQDGSWPVRLAEETAIAIGPQAKTPAAVPQVKTPAPDRYVIHMGDKPDMYLRELGAANNSLGMEMKWTVKRYAKVQTKADAEKAMQGMQSIAKAGGFYAPLKIEPAE